MRKRSNPNAEFLYHRKDGRNRTFAANMDMMDLAIEPSYIARKLYQAIAQQDPEQAELFKKMVIDAVNSPVTWDLTNAKPPEFAKIITVPKKTECRVNLNQNNQSIF